MEITLFQGLLISLLVLLFAIDWKLEGFFIFRPIIVAPVVGLIVGDLNTGLLAGGLVELAFAGITQVGGVLPPDPVMTSVMTVVLAKTTGQNVSASFALAIPFGLLMQYYGTLNYTLLSFFNKRADEYAKVNNFKGIMRLCVWGIVLFAGGYALFAFLSTYVAQNAMRDLVDIMPEWLTHGFEVAGGLIPAIGFAMLLRVMLKGQYIPYLLAGFLFATFIIFGNILPVAVMGLSFALLEYYREGSMKGVENNEGI